MNPFVRWMVMLVFSGLCWQGLPAQKPEVIHLQDFLSWTAADNDTLYVLNFWSTWCGPCVAELPRFDRVQKEMEAQKVKVIFISLDFKNQFDSKLVPFLAKKKLYSKVVLMDEPKFNDWIDKVSPEWSGAIPATLFVQHGGAIRHFHEGDFSYEALNATINRLLSKNENENN